MSKTKSFEKLKCLGNGLALYLNKKALKHLGVYKDSDICLTFNKNKTITISKATYSDTVIEDIIQQFCKLD